MLEQSAGASAAQAFGPVQSALLFEQPVNRGGADLEQLMANRLR